MSNQAPPQYSPDGRYWWDGRQWRLTLQPPLSAPTPLATPERSHMGRYMLIASVSALVLLVGILIGVAGASGSSAAKQAGTPGRATAPGKFGAPAAQPAVAPLTATDDGVTVKISNVRNDASGGSTQPESGNVFVTMDVTFSNVGTREYNANPFTFVLKDGAGIKHAVTSTESTAFWKAVNLTQGSSITKSLAFEATANRPAGLVLVWTPHLFAADHNIPL
jgi:hypothetical protein